MDNVGYLSLTNAAMIGRATDVTANNIANANTDGFRAGRITFEEMVSETGAEGPLDEMSYAIDVGTWSDTAEGALVATGNPFDLALQGGGWFGFQTEEGETAVGRVGQLTKTDDGALVTAGGDSLLGAGGGPVLLPPEATEISIARDGTISTPNGDVIGQVGIFQADEAHTWKRQAGGMLLAPGDAGPLVPAVDGNVLQGFVEKSNVDPIGEMMRLINLQRAYERSMNLADSADQLRSDTLSRLGKPAT